DAGGGVFEEVPRDALPGCGVVAVGEGFVGRPAAHRPVGGADREGPPEAEQGESQQRNPILTWPAHASPPGIEKNVPAPLSVLGRCRTRGYERAAGGFT